MVRCAGVASREQPTKQRRSRAPRRVILGDVTHHLTCRSGPGTDARAGWAAASAWRAPPGADALAASEGPRGASVQRTC